MQVPRHGPYSSNTGGQTCHRKRKAHSAHGAFHHTSSRVFLECVSQTASVQDERRIVQQARLSPQAPSKTDNPEHDSGPMPTLPWSVAEAAKGRPPSQLSSKTDDSGNPDYENIYSGLAEVLPSNLADATSLARRMCQKARKPCSVAFTTKRTVTEGGDAAAYKLWGACAECKPGCSFRARVAVWISGPAEGKVTVDCRGQHDRKAFAQGGRLLSAEVQNVVNDHVDSGAPITTPSLREALRRAGLEFSCDSGQLHNLVVLQLRPSWLR